MSKNKIIKKKQQIINSINPIMFKGGSLNTTNNNQQQQNLLFYFYYFFFFLFNAKVT